MDHLLSLYQKYLTMDTTVASDCELHVEMMADDTFDGSPDGWSFNTVGGYWLIVYSVNGKAKFAFETERTIRKMTVFVRQLNDAAIALQYAVLLALKDCCVGLHGVTLLCGDKIAVLSAPSGTGKTTLAHLLEKYKDAIVINGDFAMLSVEGNGVIFEPTPFCGSSGRRLNHRLRIDHVVFLEQSPDNRWRNLSGREAVTRFLSNSYVPQWDMDVRRTIQNNILQIIPLIQVSSFAFTPEQKAAEMFAMNCMKT